MVGFGLPGCDATFMDIRNPVLVVDDQETFRQAARAVISRLDGFEVAGEASDGREAIELAGALRPALVLMDINLPGINGIEATRRILSAYPETVVILCSTHEVADVAPDAAASGAAGYLVKEHLAPETLRQMWEGCGSGKFTTR